MKKLICILMAIAMICSLAACGTDDKDSSKNKEDKKTDSNVAVQDKENTTKPEDVQTDTDDNSEEIAELEKVAEYVEGIFDTNISTYDKKVDTANSMISFNDDAKETDLKLDLTLDGIHIEEGTPVKTLIDDGYTMSEADKEVEAHHVMSTFYMSKAENDIVTSIHVLNDTDSNKPAKDCKITGIYCDEKCIDYVEYKGLTAASSLDEVINALGNPTSIQIYKISNRPPCMIVSYKTPYKDGKIMHLDITLSYENNDTNIYNLRLA